MKVIRTIIYEGDEEWIKSTLSKSLPDGVRKIDLRLKTPTITVMTHETHYYELLMEELENGPC